MKGKCMNIKRIIRFQDDFDQVKSHPKEPKDISANVNVLKEDVISTAEDESQNLQGKENKPYTRLKECIERVLIDARTNMIGVFGMNADKVVFGDCREYIYTQINYLGTIEYYKSSDIYNNIAALLLKFIEREFSTRADMKFYVSELYTEIQKIYDNHNDYYRYEPSLLALSKIYLKYERDRNILQILNRIKQLKNYLSFSESQQTKFIMIVELVEVDYDVLNKLSKLNCSDLIIIVCCTIGIDLADTILANEIGGGKDYIYKFFPNSNCVILE